MKNLIFVLAVLVWAGCNQQPVGDADLLCVDAGGNAFKPSTLRWSSGSVLAYEYDFDSTVAYDLGNSEQCDWNKLGGVSADLVTNHENSLMIGWRYDLSGQLLLAPYYHQGGETFWASAPCTDYAGSFNVDPALWYVALQPTERFEVHWNIQSPTVVSVTVLTDAYTVFYEHEFPEADFTRWREIGVWFGGSQPAPQEICVRRLMLAFE